MVTEYEDMFNALSYFAPTLVDTRDKRCRHFLERLYLSIWDPLEDLRLTDYINLVDRATNK